MEETKEINQEKHLRNQKKKPITGLKSARSSGGGMGSGRRGEQRQLEQYQKKAIRTHNKEAINKFQISHPTELEKKKQI